MNKLSLDLDEDISLVHKDTISSNTQTKLLETTNTMIPFKTSNGIYKTKSIQDITPEEFMSWVHEVFPYPDELLERAIKASGRKEILGGSLKQRQALFEVIVSSWQNKWLFTGRTSSPSSPRLWN